MSVTPGWRKPQILENVRSPTLHCSPICLHGFFWHFAWSPPTHCLAPPPLRRNPSRAVSLYFFSCPPRCKQATRGAWVSQSSAVHMFGSNRLTTFMTAVFYHLCPTGKGELIKWVYRRSMLVRVCVCRCGGRGVHQPAQCVKVSLCCQGLSLLAARPACRLCVCARQMER